MQLSREIYSGEAIHITSTFLAVLGAIGSVCSIVSLVLYLLDKKREKDNEKRSEPSAHQTAHGLRVRPSAR